MSRYRAPLRRLLLAGRRRGPRGARRPAAARRSRVRAVPRRRVPGVRVRARLGVPLDRTGAVPGDGPALRAAPARRRPDRADATALVALAGGPGQAAAPAAASFAIALAPALRERDLIVFDQRGTGRSGPLQLPALRAARHAARVVGALRAGARARRAASTARADSVDDLEALRARGRLRASSRSTASRTARRSRSTTPRSYPDRVERLVLDSVVPPDGPDPLQRSSFRAVPRHAARAVRRRPLPRRRRPTRSPTSARSSRRGRDDPRHATSTSRGRRRARARRRRRRIYDDPRQRRPEPGVARAAARAPCAPRCAATDAARCASAPRRSAASGGSAAARCSATTPASTSALFLATHLRGASRSRGTARRARRRASTRPRPRCAREPVDDVLAVRPRRPPRAAASLGQCLGWPNATPAPGPARPRSRPCPTLILNGAADLRTPAERRGGGRRRGSPGAQLVTVPHVGHSVLGARPVAAARARRSPASSTARASTPCPASRAGGRADRARRPRSLGELPRTGSLPRPRRPHGHRGAAHARGRARPGARRAPGRRRARASAACAAARSRAADAGVTLRNVVVVPGVTVSGRFPDGAATRACRVSGRSAARGTLTLTRAAGITGRLGGPPHPPRARALRRRACRDAEAFRFAHPGLVRAARLSAARRHRAPRARARCGELDRPRVGRAARPRCRRPGAGARRGRRGAAGSGRGGASASSGVEEREAGLAGRRRARPRPRG